MDYTDRKKENYQSNPTKITFARICMPVHVRNCILYFLYVKAVTLILRRIGILMSPTIISLMQVSLGNILFSIKISYVRQIIPLQSFDVFVAYIVKMILQSSEM